MSRTGVKRKSSEETEDYEVGDKAEAPALLRSTLRDTNSTPLKKQSSPYIGVTKV